MSKRFVRLAIGAAVAVTAVTATVRPAEAWKPYTHILTGDNAWLDATDDGHVTINGNAYPVNPRLLLALQTKRPFYDAGVIGPDGYPDLIMGQSVIHGANTGLWLRHTLNKAWDAQTDPRYTEDQKLEILAFAYGFLTHAAGDMWAHTLVNDFAEGVFPAVGEIASDPAVAVIALRHIIIEGYIGDATPGFDGNPDRTFVPGEVNEDGDPQVSDDSTPGNPFGRPPDLFLWETFIGRAPDATGALTLPLPGQPTADRGPLQGFFYTLRNNLAEHAGTNSNIAAAVNRFNELQDNIAEVEEECSFPPNVVQCPIALAKLGFESLEAVLAAAANLIAGAIEEIVDAYLRAWVEDIDDGLRHWSRVGDAFTSGMFDPAVRRAYQDEECGETGTGEFSAARAACEDGIGIIGTVLDRLGEGFTTEEPNLLSMLGFPDFVATGIELIDEVLDAIDALIDLPLPLENELAEFAEFMRGLALDALSEVLGFDVELLTAILANPSAWLDGPGTPVPLPPPLDVFNGTGLFVAGEHARLDTIIGFDEPGLMDEHHDLSPGSNRRLHDDAELVISEFAPLENTITTAKLILLDGDQLDAALSDILGRTMDTYPSGVRTNVMINALDGGDPWLLSIDSDHAWRHDGLPRFCDDTPGALCLPGSDPRPPAMNGGRGQMPIWESCVARPAFAALFTDWENGASQFPALGDSPSADPGSDPNAPTSGITLDPGAAVFDDPVSGRRFVGGDNEFTLTAEDTPAGKAFPVEQLELQYRVTDPDGLTTPWTSVTPGDTFSLAGGDGKYVVETQSGDPCHTLDPSDALPAETVQSFELWLDTTAPVCTCNNPPFGATFDSDDFSTVDFDVDDGVVGSGVASVAATLDGYVTDPAATTPIADGDTLDMYLLYPGLRTVEVTAADQIGNTSVTGCTFTIQVTSQSLSNNLDRASAEGDVPNPDVYRGLRDKLNQAKKKHDQGKHAVEHNALAAFVEQILGQIGGGPSPSGIDPVVGRRFIANAQDIIDRGA